MEDAVDVCDNEPVVGHRHALVGGTLVAVAHFAFVEHARAAVDDDFVGPEVFGELRSGAGFDDDVLAAELLEPAGDFDGSDIVALTVVGAAFGDEDAVADTSPAPSNRSAAAGSPASSLK